MITNDGYIEFEFDLPGALLAHLVSALDGMIPAVMSPENLVKIPETQGVYQLFLDGQLVYIGKTDGEAGLKHRLERHSRKFLHRTGIDLARVTFKAVRIFVFTAVDLETQLIAHYGGSAIVKWNGSGFGSNDPGRERDTTKYKDEHFDAQFPIDIDVPLDGEILGKGTAAVVLKRLRNLLPYTFRFEGGVKQKHPDLEGIEVDVSNLKTVRQVLEKILKKLPIGWQATALPSHLSQSCQPRQ